MAFMDKARRAVTKGRKCLKKLGGSSLWILLIVTYIIVLYLTVSFSFTYYQVISNANPTEVGILNFMYYFDSFKNLSSENKQSVLSFIINMLILIITIATTLVTLVSHKKKERKLEKSTGIRKYKIPDDEIGELDIQIMNDEFKGANEVTIFAGDFDWLTKEVIKGTVTDLAKNRKLKLFSDKTEESIRKMLGTDYSTFESCIIYYQKRSDSSKIRCSLVEKGNNYKFLYSQSVPEDDSDQNYVFVLRRNTEGQYLVDMLHALIMSLEAEYEKAEV